MSCETTDPLELSYVQNDRKPFLTILYQDENGDPINITSYSFEFHIKFETAGPKTQVGVIIDAAGGEFEFQWDVGYFEEVGVFPAEIEITDAGGYNVTYQNILVEVTAEIA